MRSIIFVLALTAAGWANAAGDRSTIVPRTSDLMTCAILLGLPVEGSSLTETAYGRALPKVFDEAGWPRTDDIAVSETVTLDLFLASSDVRATHFGRRIEGREKVAEFLRTVVTESARRGRQLADELPEKFWTTRRLRQILSGDGFAEELEQRTYAAARAPGAPFISEALVWAHLHRMIPNVQFRAELLVRLAVDRDLRTEWLNSDGRGQRDFHQAIANLMTPIPTTEADLLSAGPYFSGVMSEDQLHRWVDSPYTETVRLVLQCLFWDVKLLTDRDPKIGENDAVPFEIRTFVRRDEAGDPVELIVRGLVVHLPPKAK